MRLHVHVKLFSVDELEKYFSSWLGEGISDFDKILQQRLYHGVKTYRRALEERMAEIESGTKNRIEHIEQYRVPIRDAVRAINDALRWREFIDG